jgi:hypothetical protein
MNDAVSQLHDLRRRVLAGEEVSPEEYGQVIDSLREGRKNASAAGKKKGGAKSNVQLPVDINDLFKTNV